MPADSARQVPEWQFWHRGRTWRGVQTRPWVQAVTLRAPMLAPASSYSLQMLPSVPSEAVPSDSMSCSGCVTLLWALPRGLQAAGASRLPTKQEARPLTSKQSVCSLPLRHPPNSQQLLTDVLLRVS